MRHISDVLAKWSDELAHPRCRQCGELALPGWRLCGPCWQAKFGDGRPAASVRFHGGEQLELDVDDRPAA